MGIISKFTRHVSNQATRRHVHDDLHPALFGISALVALHLALAQREFLHDAARILLPDRHRALLDGLEPLALLLALLIGLGAGDHDRLGRADAQLEALAAERLEQDTEVQHAAPAQLERLGGGAGEHGERDVRLGLFVDAVANHLRGELRAFAAGKWGVVGVDVDRDGGRVNGRGLS